jgi:hypothetical protein
LSTIVVDLSTEGLRRVTRGHFLEHVIVMGTNAPANINREARFACRSLKYCALPSHFVLRVFETILVGRWRNERFHAITADGSGLLALSYRGYGGASGRPTD